MTKPTKLADGSGNNLRTEAACVRALDAYMNLERRADRLLQVLDDITIPGVVRHQITDEDSLVIAIRDVTAPADVVDPTNPTPASGKKPEMGG